MPGSMKRGSVTEKQHRDEESCPLLVSGSSHGVRSAGRERRARPGTKRELRGHKSKRKTPDPNKANGKMPLFPRAG